MIKKIEIETVNNAGELLLVCAAIINELVDAVNELKGAKNE